jgi:hypothetical protein
MAKKDFRKHQKYVLPSPGEADPPKSDELNVWDAKFGWILKNGKPTITTKAYWQAQRRKMKQ